MNKFIHLQAFELLGIVLIADCKGKNLAESKLSTLAEQLGRHYQTVEFAQLIRLCKKTVEENLLNDDNLFVSYSKLSLRYSNLAVLKLHDRLVVFTCIALWIRRFEFSGELINLVGRILEIAAVHSHVIFETMAGVKHSMDSGEDTLLCLEPARRSGDTLDGNWIKHNQPRELSREGIHFLEELPLPLSVLFIHEIKVFFIFCDNAERKLTKNGETNLCGMEYLEPGDSLEVEGVKVFDYYDLKRRYLATKELENLTIKVAGVSFAFGTGKSLRKLDLRIEAGTLAGILGREGTGKSTILNLLAGDIKSPTGDILINDYSFRRELYHLKGMIGYVPESDMLFQELSVYDNLFYSARLYLGNLKEAELKEKVRSLLAELNLLSVAGMIVGSYQDKFLQPGQRRLLNIALELIRDPQVLIVDNAISSLSLSDSSKVVDVLSSYTFKGRIVITSITQTDRKIFQCFDKLLVLDEGGYPIVFEKTGQAFDLLTEAADLPRRPGFRPGPNDILGLLDQPVYNKRIGRNERYKSPAELRAYIEQHAEQETETVPVRKKLPRNILQPPTLERQYYILNLRNFKTKLSRTRELLVTVFSAPALSLLVSVFLRGNLSETYSFHSNRNIPVFFFLSFIVAYFLGLVLSAREVFSEQKIIQKQTYLNISKFSYVNSKITYLFLIALLQSFLFTGISHLILEIRGMLWMHLLIYFSVQSTGLLTGLILSESHVNLENIYSRTIPVLILLQVILGCGLIKLDALQGSRRYTPLMSDLMVTRWAQEAMLVHQFSNNSFMRDQYQHYRDYSTGYIHTFHRVPEIKEQLEYCRHTGIDNMDSMELVLKSVRTQLSRFPRYFDIFPYENIHHLNPTEFNDSIAADLSEYMEYVNLYFISLFENASNAKTSYERMISDSLGENYLSVMGERFTNEAIENEVTNSFSGTVLETTVLPSVQKVDQIYQYPDGNAGRTQLYLPFKSVNGQLINTVEFDISIIWLFNLLLYILLLSDVGFRFRKR